jgi:hypothetical protein
MKMGACTRKSALEIYATSVPQARSELEPFQQLRCDTGAIQVKADLVPRILRQTGLGDSNTAHDGMIVVHTGDFRVNLRIDGLQRPD